MCSTEQDIKQTQAKQAGRLGMTPTTSSIEVDETGYSSKQIASGMGDRANECPCVAVHLDRRYDVVNVKINGKHKDHGSHS